MGKVSSFRPYPAPAGEIASTGQAGSFTFLTYNSSVALGLPAVFSMITLSGLSFHNTVQLCLVPPSCQYVPRAGTSPSTASARVVPVTGLSWFLFRAGSFLGRERE